MKGSNQVQTKADRVINYCRDFYSTSDINILSVSSILTSFGILGVIWSIPFPHLEFLGKFNGFVNWASFLIAIAIYYYYTMSAVVSYGLLLFIFAFSALIVTLEKMHRLNGWPSMGLVSVVMLGIGIMLQQLATSKYNGRVNRFALLAYTPFFLMYTLFQKLKIIK